MFLLHWLLTLCLAALLGEASPDSKPLGSSEFERAWVVWLKNGSEKSLQEHAGWATSVIREQPGHLRGISEVVRLMSGMQSHRGKFTEQVANMIREDKDVSVCWS